MISFWSLLLFKNSTFDQVPGWYDPKPFVPLRDSVAQPLIRCQDEYDPKPIKRSSMIVDGVWEDWTLNLRTLSRQVPLGMTLNPSSLSGTQRLNLWSKGFWERWEREREEKRSKDQSLRRKEGRKEGKAFLWFLVFDLERALWRRDVDLKKGWVGGWVFQGKGREKGFWVLVVLACFWGRVLVFGFWSMIDEVDGTKVLITIKGIGLKVWVFFLLAKRLQNKGFFTCF
jgi:hypothetical protein